MTRFDLLAHSLFNTQDFQEWQQAPIALVLRIQHLAVGKRYILNTTGISGFRFRIVQVWSRDLAFLLGEKLSRGYLSSLHSVL